MSLETAWSDNQDSLDTIKTIISLIQLISLRIELNIPMLFVPATTTTGALCVRSLTMIARNDVLNIFQLLSVCLTHSRAKLLLVREP